jgi:peptidoglycan biosynthesis protein MviN/MurJ (putative lipid II flippase)
VHDCKRFLVALLQSSNTSISTTQPNGEWERIGMAACSTAGYICVLFLDGVLVLESTEALGTMSNQLNEASHVMCITVQQLMAPTILMIGLRTCLGSMLQGWHS